MKAAVSSDAALPREVLERDHEIQNPTSPDKIRLVGEYMRLGRESRVLDVACGQGGPATILCEAYGCRILGVELREGFAAEARARIAARGLDTLIEVRVGDAAALELETETWDAALCIGAAFVWGTIADAAAALGPAVRRGGFVAIGEPFWRQWPLPGGVDAEGFVGLEETVARFESAGLATTGVVAASEDDWDRYKSLQWRALEKWLSEHPDHPEAKAIHEQHVRRRGDYLRSKRALLGWAVFVGRT